MTEPRRQRLDLALVNRGLVSSRARGQDLVARGEVLLNGSPVRRASALVAEGDRIELSSGAGDYVSRGALKLAAALDAFGYAVDGRTCLDVGASTGGFTDTLLRRGARRVYAVDNGRDQLNQRLRTDPRVVSIEGQDARRLSRAEIPETIDAIVADVSFISLTKALPAPLGLAAARCWLIALVKPQFELAPGQVPRNGVVTDPDLRHQALEHVAGWLARCSGWTLDRSIESPIAGGEGNREFLLGAQYAG